MGKASVAGLGGGIDLACVPTKISSVSRSTARIWFNGTSVDLNYGNLVETNLDMTQPFHTVSPIYATCQFIDGIFFIKLDRT